METKYNKGECMIGGMFSFFDDIGNYEQRKVDRTQVGTLQVSTANTSDEGYETAILDNGNPNVHPVERYETREEAIKGHAKWCKKAKTIKSVIKLGGMGGLVKNERVKIVR